MLRIKSVLILKMLNSSILTSIFDLVLRLMISVLSCSNLFKIALKVYQESSEKNFYLRLIFAFNYYNTIFQSKNF